MHIHICKNFRSIPAVLLQNLILQNGFHASRSRGLTVPRRSRSTRSGASSTSGGPVYTFLSATGPMQTYGKSYTVVAL